MSSLCLLICHFHYCSASWHESNHARGCVNSCETTFTVNTEGLRLLKVVKLLSLFRRSKTFTLWSIFYSFCNYSGELYAKCDPFVFFNGGVSFLPYLQWDGAQLIDIKILHFLCDLYLLFLLWCMRACASADFNLAINTCLCFLIWTLKSYWTSLLGFWNSFDIVNVWS